MTGADKTSVALQVLQDGADALRGLVESFDQATFEKAAELILKSDGYCIVTGMGKSGHIGKKIAATLASTGTPAFFLHPSEARHGDLGMIVPGSTLLAFSNSGESEELKPVLAYCRTTGIAVIAITGQGQSSLAKAATVTVLLPKVPEACPNGLAPTTSTTMSLALGDALAISVMSLREFSADDFGRRHPGGKLGLQLQTAGEWMDYHSTACPTLPATAGARDVISTITAARTGCVGIIDDSGALVGIVTDGDLRRALEGDIFAQSAVDLMTRNPIIVSVETRMRHVVDLMKENHIGNIYIVNKGRPLAVINLKDLVEMGYV